MEAENQQVDLVPFNVVQDIGERVSGTDECARLTGLERVLGYCRFDRIMKVRLEPGELFSGVCVCRMNELQGIYPGGKGVGKSECNWYSLGRLRGAVGYVEDAANVQGSGAEYIHIGADGEHGARGMTKNSLSGRTHDMSVD